MSEETKAAEIEEDETVFIDDKSEALVEQVIKQLNSKDYKALKKTLAQIEESEILFLVNSLSTHQEGIVFRLLKKDHALYIFEHLEVENQKKALLSLTDEKTIEFIEELDPDDRVELLDEMPAAIARRLIAGLSAEERKITNMIMGYASETAGRIMTPKFISLRRDMTADEALAKVRRQAREEDKETVYTLYVTDEHKKLEGVVSLKDILVADNNSRVEDFMEEKVVKVTTNTDQEEAANALKEFDLLAIPVVDKEDRIVGIITIDDAVDILEDEATEDILNKAGLANIRKKETSRSEVLIRGSIWAIWKIRLPFLGITLLFGIVAGLILYSFEQTLQTVALAMVFLPLIMDMGGSVGTQSSTLFVRGMALGHIDPKRFGRHLGRELRNGLTMGAIIGTVSGGIAAIWGHLSRDGSPLIGLAVGVALFFTIIFSVLFGFLIPFILTKMKLDNAAGASPIITALKDFTSIIVYFVIVSLFFIWI